MSDLSIKKDYDYDDSEVFFTESFGDDIDRLNSDSALAEQLVASIDAIDDHGITPSAFGIMQTAGLLSGTSLQTLAMESIHTTSPEDPESQMAMEALGEKLKETMVAWSTRILHFAKNMTIKMMGYLDQVWSVISNQVKSLSSYAWDQTKAAGRVIKAHPYKSIAIALTAAATVASIIMFASSNATTLVDGEIGVKGYLSKIKDMISRIHWPFGKMNVECVQDGMKIVYKLEDGNTLVKISETPVKLGWTQSAVKSISGQTSRLFQNLKTGLTHMGSSALNVAKKVNEIEDPGAAAKTFTTKKTGSKITGWVSQQVMNKIVSTALWSVIGVLYMLLKDVAFKTLQMIKDSFRTLDSNLKPA